MSSKDNLALDLEHGVRRWDRQRWISVFSSHSPTIREVTECLGLGLSASSSTTNRGIPKFDNPDYRKLSSEVTKLSKELPKERDALLDFAADPHSLDSELKELLGTYGPAIWGRDADRTCLLTPDPTKKTYNKDLFYDDAEHREILKIHLHRWIIIKACYYIRNMKLKRPSGTNDYDSLAEIEGEVGSQHGTPQSLSPPEPEAPAGANFEVKAVPNLKKRKSSAYLGGGSMSDGEEHPSSPAKRPYTTIPIGRRSASPRKSLKSFSASSPGSTENIPLLPVRPYVSPTPNHGPESARVQLSSMSSNEVNGSSGPHSAASAPAGGFVPLNTNSSFTAVNTPPLPAAPPVREASNEASRAPSLDAKMTSPPPIRVEPRAAYTSPYDAVPSNVNAPTSTPDPRSTSVASAASVPGQGLRAINSPTSASSIVNRDMSAAQAPLQSVFGSTPQATPPVQAHPQNSPQSQAAQMKPRSESQPHALTPSRTHVHLHQQQGPVPSLNRAHTSSSNPASRSIAPHPSSRSNTPLPQETNGQPAKPHTQQIAPAPAPTEMHAPIHGMRIVPSVVSAHPPPPAAASAQPPQPVLKSQPIDVAPSHQQRPAVPMVELRLLQCEVLALLIQYMFPKPTSPPDERVVVSQIQNLWYLGEVMFRADLGPHYDMCSRVLHAWLHERQSITSLRHSLMTQPGVSAAGIMDRLLAMNDLRVMRLKWKNMSPLEGASPEDLLCRTFAAISNTENTEHLFRDGLDRLNRGVFEFLRNEDSKIVVQRR